MWKVSAANFQAQSGVQPKKSCLTVLLPHPTNELRAVALSVKLGTHKSIEGTMT
jgi:hypothetical protein